MPLRDLADPDHLPALDRRYAFALPNITVGRVTDAIVRELEQIAVEYDTLLRGGAALSSRFSEAAVRAKIGDALGSAAWACEALQEPERARAFFMAAAIIYTRAGATEKARRCRMELDRLNFYRASDAAPAARSSRAVAR